MRTAYCFDMDGTLTRQEVLPIIARQLGIEPEISVLTQATINGILPFDQSFRLRVRLLSQYPVKTVCQIVRNIILHDKIINFIRSKPEDCYIVTGNLDVWIVDFMNFVGCKYYCSQAELENGEIKGISHILNKSEAISKVRALGYDRIVSVGDGMNDVSMLETSDIGIAFGSVHAPVLSLIKIANYVTFSESGLCNILNML